MLCTNRRSRHKLLLKAYFNLTSGGNRMPDKVSPGPLHGNPLPKEAVCIHTRKVYDSCRDKECLQDLRVYLTRCSQAVLDGAINVKPRTAELLWAYIDVESIPFNKGFYTVDVKYFYKVTADAFAGDRTPARNSQVWRPMINARYCLAAKEACASSVRSLHRMTAMYRTLKRPTCPLRLSKWLILFCLSVKVIGWTAAAARLRAQ